MSVITPTSLVGARSPIYITAGYSDLAGSITDITLEVYIWSGARGSRPASAQYTLFRDVFAGQDVSFDIAPLVVLNTLCLEMCLQVKMYLLTLHL